MSVNKQKSKSNPCSSSTSTRWSEGLPNVVLQQIWSKLSVVDSVRFRSVCSSWRRAVSGCSLPRPFPWLPFQVYTKKIQWDVGLPLSVVSIDERRHRTFDFKNCHWFDDPRDHRRMIPLSCVEHWLIVEATWYDDPLDFGKRFLQGLFFVNLISGAVILLPRLGYFIKCAVKVVASSVPTSPNCLVAAVQSGYWLAVCRPSDKSWTDIGEDERLRFEDVAFGEPAGEHGSRRLYAIKEDSPRFLTVYDFAEIEGGIRAIRNELSISPPWPIRVPCDDNLDEMEEQRLAVGSKGELFMIWLRKAKQVPSSYYRRISTGFRVLKLKTDGGMSRYEWEEVENFFGEDKVVLFLSRGSSQFIPRSDLPAAVLEQITAPGSCIWSAEPLRCGGLATFCMETKKLEPYCCTSDDESVLKCVEEFCDPAWFMHKAW